MNEERTFRLTVAYDGTAFHGWQRQPDQRTAQGVLEQALSAVLESPVQVNGAGRTDAGVHARGQVAHLDLANEFALGGLVHGTNQRLPADVRVLDAAAAPVEFHARFSATAKRYSYRCLRARIAPPREAPFALAVPEALDLDALAEATRQLPGRHDFAAFALAGGAHTSSVRTIYAASWIDEPPFLTLSVVGDGFLRGMVRGLAGTLLEVALGRRRVTEFAALLDGGERSAAGPTAPAHALTLERVWFAPRGRPNAVVASNE